MFSEVKWVANGETKRVSKNHSNMAEDPLGFVEVAFPPPLEKMVVVGR